MIYLIDRGFRINNALNILVNQCKYPGIYNECFRLGCNVNDKYNLNDNDKVYDNDKDNDRVKDNVNDKDNDLRSSFTNNDNDNDLRSSFANNVNDSVKDLRSSFANQGTDGVRGIPTCSADNDNDLRSSFANKDKDNDNDLRSSFANDDNDNVINLRSSFADNVIYQFDEKHGETWQAKPYPKRKPNTISMYINEDLQSWLNDDNIITEATLPENFRFIISCPSECGKTFLLNKLILASIYFDTLYIIGPTGDQYTNISCKSVEFVKDIKDLPSPDKLPKDLKKLMIFDDVRAKEQVINEYFCRGRHNNCNTIYLTQNLFPIDKQSVRENCNLFILFEQRGKVLISIYQDFFNNVELSYNDFANICSKVWKEPYNYFVIDITKNKNINGKLRINWDRRVL